MVEEEKVKKLRIWRMGELYVWVVDPRKRGSGIFCKKCKARLKSQNDYES